MPKRKLHQKFHIKKDDTVKVIAGNEKGKTGKVVSVLTQKQRAIVQGLNMVTYHVKPKNENQAGGRKQKEASIHISNLMVIDTSTNTPSRIGRRKNEQNKLQRYAKKTNNLL